VHQHSNLAAIGQPLAQISRFIIFFQYSGRPPSWICFASVRTIREEYFVVFIVVQNLVGIGAVVSVICTILDLAVWLENTYSRFQNWRFGGLDPHLLNGRQINETPERHILGRKDVVRKSVHRCDLCA